MKTLRLLSCALGVMFSVQFTLVAQATFALLNRNVVVPILDWNGSPLEGSAWRAELYGGASVDSLQPTIGATSGTRVLAPFVGHGYFYGADYVYVPDVLAGGWAWLQLKVWDIDLGPTYEAAVARDAGGFGQSAVFYTQGGDPSVPTFPAPLLGLTSFGVSQVVPEPAVSWLLLAGLPALWWRWRGRWKAEG